MFNNKKGFTLMELIISLSIFSIVSISVFNLFFYTSNFYSKSLIEEEIFENVQLAMDFFEMQIRYANRIDIDYSYNKKTIGTVDVYFNEIDKTLESVNQHSFVFKKDSTSGTDFNGNTLKFGGREGGMENGQVYTSNLCEYIDDIIFDFDSDNKILKITIKSSKNLDPTSKDLIEPIILIRQIDVEDKTVNIKRRTN